MQSSKYPELFVELGQSLQKSKIQQDAQVFFEQLNEHAAKSSELLQYQNDKNSKMMQTFQKYLQEFEYLIKKCEGNLKNFEAQIKKNEIVSKNFIGMPITDFVDLPKDFEKPPWFDVFLKDEMIKLQKTLEDLGQQLYKARITDEILENRTKIVKNTQLLVEDLKQKQANGQLPKEKIIQFEKMICELSQYDQIIPQIMADISNKVSDYLKSILALTTEFRHRCKKNLDNIKFTTFENDKAYQFEYNNIKMMDPQRVRASRFNIVIRNEDLVTLQEGLPLAERIPKFFVEYLREKQQYLNQKKVQSIMIMKSDFFESLIPPGCVLDWNNIRFTDVKSQTSEYSGKESTIFDKFSKIMISVLLSAKNFILIEIKNKPEKEILIYDSDFAMFSIFHEKIIKCVRAYIIEEYRDKADMSEVESIEMAKNYVGRSVNCPQVNYPHENGIFFLKNLILCQQGKAISPASYSGDQLGNFRLQLFSTLLRIGLNEDRTLPFDVLI